MFLRPPAMGFIFLQNASLINKPTLGQPKASLVFNNDECEIF